jgi:hypothetical protein
MPSILPTQIIPGARVSLTRDTDRYPHFLAPAGATGTVAEVDAECVWVHMDDFLPGAEEWGNRIQWHRDDGYPTTDDPREVAAPDLTLLAPATPEARLDAAIDAAQRAFWAALAAAYPEIRTGDLSPDVDLMFSAASTEAAREWVAGNLPTPSTTITGEN